MNAIRNGYPGPLLLWSALLLALILLGNLWALFGIGLLPDEAYYWVWSQRLELSYFDHPPLVAWLMWPFTELFGSAAAVVRSPAVLSWLVGAVVAYDLSRRIYEDRRAGLLAVLIWSGLPIVQAGFHVVTPDSGLMIFSWLTYYFAYLAVARAEPRYWLLTGSCVGLALLAKYPAVLVLAGLFLALLLSAEGRRQLAGPWPWLGALLALVLFLPVVYWNWQHDWASFGFQFSHGVQEAISPAPLSMLLMFIGGQMAVAMPWTFVAMIWASLRPGDIGGYNRLLLGFGLWMPLVVFGIAGLTASSGPNWPETAYVTGTVLLAGLLCRWLYGGAGRGIVVKGGLVALLLIGVVLMNMLRFPSWLEALGVESAGKQRTQLSQSYGWDKVGEELKRVLPGAERNSAEGDQCKVLADNHARAGMIAWLLRAPERVGVSANTRFNQYNLWRRESLQPKPCLYVQKFESDSWRENEIPLSQELPEGRWRRVSLIETRNPDLSRRWFGFYVPEQ